MVDFWAIRKGDYLVPDGAESAAAFSKIPFGKPVKVEAKQPRNAAHLRLYWKLCARIAEAVGAERETVSDLLKVRTGSVRIIQTKNGIEKFPTSISFVNMDQTAFSAFFERCLVVIYEEFGIARPDILPFIEDLLVPTERRVA